MNDIDSIFDLVGIKDVSARAGASSGAGRRGSSPYNPFQGWAVKDDAGTSSIAQSNRETRKAQLLDKGKDVYEDYLKEMYGDDWELESKLFGEKSWEDMTEEEKLNIATALGADKSSVEQSNIRRNKKEEAEETARENKRENENERRKEKHEDKFKNWRPPPNQTPQRDKPKGGGDDEGDKEGDGEAEEKPISTADEAEEGGSVDPNAPVSQAEYSAFKEVVEQHMANTQIHNYG